MKKTAKTILLIANGDLRQSANEATWAAQAEMEAKLTETVKSFGYKLVRAHPYKKDLKHGFIGSQKEGMKVFARINPKTPIIVAEAVWQYSHHILAGLISHQAPILTIANWSGQWPGLVGMLNLNGSLTKAGVTYSTLWSELRRHGFSSTGCRSGSRPAWSSTLPPRQGPVPGQGTCPGQDRSRPDRHPDEDGKAIMGIFDEGCMGMYNAIIPDECSTPRRLQGAPQPVRPLLRMTTGQGREAKAVYAGWLEIRAMTFDSRQPGKSQLTEDQVLSSARCTSPPCASPTTSAAIHRHPVPAGLKDLVPASDLVEGLLNNCSSARRSRTPRPIILRGPTPAPLQRGRRVRRRSTPS
jgi:hypothetical protein